MKSYSKTLIAGLILLIATAVNISAIDYSGTLNTNGNTRIFSGSGKLTIVQITASSAAAVTVNFYDAATNQIVYTNAAYTSYSSYVTNITALYTNTQGFIQTNTTSKLWTYATSVAANTNVSYPIIASVTVPASGTIVRSFSPYLNIAQGLTASCTGTGVVANISYTQ